MRINTKVQCVECNRVFDLLDENDANEWEYGHDCEIVDFDDLPENQRNKYIQEAFQELVNDNAVPYSVQNGDDGVWNEYEPAINLARQNYINN